MKKVFLFTLMAVLFSCISDDTPDNKSVVIDAVHDGSLNPNDIIINLINSGVVENETDHYHVKYLGKAETETGYYHIINLSIYFNIKVSPRAINGIYIYDQKMKNIGTYHMDMKEELPKKIEANNLYFGCSNKSEIIVNLDLGIPKFININCEEDNFFELTSSAKNE